MNLPLISAALLTSTSPLPSGAMNDVVVPDPLISALAAQPVEDATSPEGPAAEAVTVEDPQDQEEVSQDGNTIVVSADSEARKRDPLVKINESAFAITQNVDRAVVEPVADAYKGGLPKPVRRGLRNFFRNLLEPVNFLNYLLQLKPGKAFETLGRFTINSTIGVAGLIDVAKEEPFNLPYRRNGFANTLGYYGVGPGPFLVLPLIGATSLRDVLGSGLDQAVLPFAVGKPFNTPAYAIPAYTVNSLEFRIEFDERLEAINESDDPYYALRESYLCQREADIAALKNRPPPRDCSLEALFSDGLEDEEGSNEIVPDSTLDTASEAVGIEAVDIEAPTESTDDTIAIPASEPGMPVTDTAGQSGAAIVELESVSLENGCALLEEGVNSLHVVTC